ncbi:hypothetical protein FA13DRAFT_1525451 [Coprinellus micaceus]|uniref:Uncharacterized protein n=1 Tax=Coprinellus micaceus TaxID=71717 RepID=A0A4Y7SJ76_COPMI|nr:hypothetical protein FA13DRAFT_1525451 [Coprinellus micaceus]
MRRRAALVLNSISLRAYLKQLPVPWQHLPCSCPWACLIATVGPWDVILCLPIFEPMPYQTHRNREALAAKSRLRLTMSYTLRSADQSHRSTNPSNHGNFPSIGTVEQYAATDHAAQGVPIVGFRELAPKRQ